jgi:hypothetical protein
VQELTRAASIRVRRCTAGALCAVMCRKQTPQIRPLLVRLTFSVVTALPYVARTAPDYGHVDYSFRRGCQSTGGTATCGTRHIGLSELDIDDAQRASRCVGCRGCYPTPWTREGMRGLLIKSAP